MLLQNETVANFPNKNQQSPVTATGPWPFSLHSFVKDLQHHQQQQQQLFTAPQFQSFRTNIPPAPSTPGSIHGDSDSFQVGSLYGEF